MLGGIIKASRNWATRFALTPSPSPRSGRGEISWCKWPAPICTICNDGSGAQIPARHGVRAPDLRVPTALRDAVAARALPQSLRAGGDRANRLGGEAAAACVARLPRSRLVDAGARLACAVRLVAGARRADEPDRARGFGRAHPRAARGRRAA